MNTETAKKEKKIGYFPGEKKGRIEITYTEKPGDWYFPPVASLITSGGRLLLAMLEKSVHKKGGSYLFCDTDSLCIVGSKAGGFVSCQGGTFRSGNRPAIKVLSLADVRSIAGKPVFRELWHKRRLFTSSRIGSTKRQFWHIDHGIYFSD